MQSAIVALVSLLLTSLTLTALMSVAWHCFGRPRHALIWAAMFATRSAAWTINLAGRLYFGPRWHWYFALVDLLAAVSGWLLVAGFIERAGTRRTPLIAIGLLGVAGTLSAMIGIALKNEAVSNAPTLAFGALCAAAAAWQLGRSRLSAAPAQAVALTMLIIVALYLAGAAIMAAGLPRADPHLDAFRLVLVLGMPGSAIAIGTVCIFLIASDLAEQMRSLALSDPLTGIFNRRGLKQAAEPLIAMCRRQGQPITVVVADLDRFKQINDRFGHAAGDALLQAFSTYTAETLRRGDLFGRIGGEEFAFLLPNTTPAQAQDAIERLRCRLASLPPLDLAPLTLTASFGIALLDTAGSELEDALAQADSALYAAKEAGRDRVVIAPPPAATAVPGLA